MKAVGKKTSRKPTGKAVTTYVGYGRQPTIRQDMSRFELTMAEAKQINKVRPGFYSLWSILHLRRCHLGQGEAKLLSYLDSLPGMQKDKVGNRYLTIGESPSVLWSAHTDTVHYFDTPIFQTLWYSFGVLGVVDDDCLGADNGAGVWMLLQLMERKVPGLYVFHRNEERGADGSKYFAQQSLVSGIKMAIAFDRRNTNSIITHQGTRTCSDAFANSLKDQLNMGHTLDPTGSFTDTKSYAHRVPECTNISVGFLAEHGPSETLDVAYLFRLRDSMLAVDTSKLVISRDPNLHEYPVYAYPQTRAGYRAPRAATSTYPKAPAVWPARGFLSDEADEAAIYAADDETTSENIRAQVLSMVKSYPALTAMIISQWGLEKDFIEELASLKLAT